VEKPDISILVLQGNLTLRTLSDLGRPLLCPTRLDAFDVVDSEFVGYWRDQMGGLSLAPEAPVGLYRRNDGSRALLIVGNLRGDERIVVVTVDPAAIGLTGERFSVVSPDGGRRTLPENGKVVLQLPAKDYRLVEVRADD
jgi:hypothetical protein